MASQSADIGSDLKEASLLAEEYLNFSDASPSPFHGTSPKFVVYKFVICFVVVVSECRKMLLTADFTEILEKNPWEIIPNGKVIFPSNSI